MRVCVGGLLAEPGAVRALAFSECVEVPAEQVTRPALVEGCLTLRATGRSVILAGRVGAVVALTCGMCLAPFEHTLDVEISEEFGRRDPARGGAVRAELEPEDFMVPLAPGDVIDVTEVVRQTVTAALPIAPRCSPDCRGLCPRCGADRNRVACACEDQADDPRLAPLRQWASGRRWPDDDPPPGS
jgi:uncharacterized protein